MTYDVIVVGGGPAGLTAGVYARMRNLSTLVLEAHALGGQLTFLYPTKSVYDYPSYVAVEAEELGRLFVAHAREAGCELHEEEEVIDLASEGKEFVVTTRKKSYRGHAVILALGMGLFEPKTLGIPGEAEFEERGVYYMLGDRRKFRGKRVLIVGGGDSALEAALQIVAVAEDVTVVHRREVFRAMEKHVDAVARAPIKVMLNSEVTQILGGDRAERAVIYNNRTLEKTELDVDAIIVQVGFAPSLEKVRKWGVELEGDRHIKVGPDMATSAPGVFACGDIVSYPGKDKRIVTAAGEAVTAIMSAYKYIRSPYWA
jgi:thioredoxin reductase (NADPH)